MQPSQVIEAKPACLACRENPARAHGPYAGHAKELLERRLHDLHGEKVDVAQCPCELRIDVKVKPRLLWVCELVSRERIVAHQPIGLVEPMFATQWHRRAGGWQPIVGHDGDIGREEDPLEVELLVQRAEELEDLVVAFRGRPYYELSRLSCRREAAS